LFKKTGPLLSILINIAIMGVSHDNKNTITADDNTISNKRFKNLLKGACNGISLNEMIGT
jgi:hypothetical protein